MAAKLSYEKEKEGRRTAEALGSLKRRRRRKEWLPVISDLKSCWPARD